MVQSALAEVDDVPVGVGQHLHLDVTGVLEVLLDVDRGVGEVRLPLALRGLERLGGLVRRVDGLHPLPAAPGGGLDQERIADLLTERDDLGGRADRVGRARDDRDAGGLHRLPGARLRAHQLDGGRRRPIQTSPAASTARAKAAFSARKPYPGWTALAPERRAASSSFSGTEIALGRRVAAERERLVRVARMERRAVRVGVDSHRTDADIPQRAEDADRDLATVGDEHFRELGHSGLFLSSRGTRGSADSCPGRRGPDRRRAVRGEVPRA